MPRIRRGGKRVRAGDGRTRKQDCCCLDPVPCATINDEPTRATWEISYEIFGLSLGSEACGAACNSVGPLSGVVPYVGGGFAIDWIRIINICGGYYYQIEASIRCESGIVTLTLSIGVHDAAPGNIWFIAWEDTVPESSFILGAEFTLPRVLSSAATASVCLPTPSNGIGTTSKFVVSVA